MTTCTPTQEERAAWEEAQELWRGISRGRATVDLRTASDSVRERSHRMGQLQDSIRPDALQIIAAEERAAWDTARLAKVAAARAELAARGWHEGDKVTAVAHSWAPTAPPYVYHGRVKVSKYGDIYVAARSPLDGKTKRYDLTDRWEREA